MCNVDDKEPEGHICENFKPNSDCFCCFHGSIHKPFTIENGDCSNIGVECDGQKSRCLSIFVWLKEGKGGEI